MVSPRFADETELEMMKPSSGNMHPGQFQGSRWIPPPAVFAKINVDVATSKNLSMVVVVTVARAAGGSFLRASTFVLKGIIGAEIAENLACREGLALVCDLLI
jgi:hypothetical protein